MIKLYEHPLSPYAQKCKIALYEKGIESEAVQRIGDFSPVSQTSENILYVAQPRLTPLRERPLTYFMPDSRGGRRCADAGG
jgi:hypothetical protein